MQNIIEKAYANKQDLSYLSYLDEVKKTITGVIAALETGELRAAENINGKWISNEWVKKAILLYFMLSENKVLTNGTTQFFDKIPLQFGNYSAAEFKSRQLRIVPPTHVRQGCHIAENTVLMPCYINIGAYIAAGTMVDNWVTVGSCAQIGKNCHIAMGVGIGGVLEPLQASPTIIEDSCFIGANCQIVEGVVIGKGSVIAMGVNIGQSTKIYHKQTGEITYGSIPPGSVVIPGSIGNENYHTDCAIIAKQVDDKTRNKIGINQLLRSLD